MAKYKPKSAPNFADKDAVERIAKAIDPVAFDSKARFYGTNRTRRQDSARKNAERALTAYHALLKEQGMKVVPKELTPEMLRSMENYRLTLQFGQQAISGTLGATNAKILWQDAFDAAPGQGE